MQAEKEDSMRKVNIFPFVICCNRQLTSWSYKWKKTVCIVHICILLPPKQLILTQQGKTCIIKYYPPSTNHQTADAIVSGTNRLFVVLSEMCQMSLWWAFSEIMSKAIALPVTFIKKSSRPNKIYFILLFKPFQQLQADGLCIGITPLILFRPITGYSIWP